MTYSINIDDIILYNEPENHKTPILNAWLDDLVGQPMQRLNDLAFISYTNGASYSHYSASNIYNIGDRINGGLNYQNVIFESLIDNNTGTFSVDNWLQILPTFIGYNERKKYLDSRVVFEWALNKYFGTTFRQPNFDDTQKSDIYIDDNEPLPQAMYIGPNDFTSDFIGPLFSYDALSNFVWVGPDPSLFAGGWTFIIQVPNSFYVTLPGYNGMSYSADQIIRNYADQINYSSMLYLVENY